MTSLNKTKQDNDVSNHIGAVYDKNEIELSWPIGPGDVCDKNQIGQWYDWLYRCGLCWKWYWTIRTYQTKCDLSRQMDKTTMWSTVQVRSMSKKKIELSWPIGPCPVYDENDLEEWHDQSSKCGICRKWYWTVRTYQTRCGLSRKPDKTMTRPIVQVQSMLKIKLN